MTTRRPNMDYAIFFLLGMIWGTNFLLMKIAGRMVSPLQVTWLRVTCGALPILGLAAWRGVLKRDHLKHLPHFSGVGHCHFDGSLPGVRARHAGSEVGSRRSDRGRGAAADRRLGGLVLPGERVSWRQALGMLAGGVGVLLVAEVTGSAVAGEHAARGLLFMLAGATGYAVAVVYQRRYVTRLKISPLALACYQTLVASALLTLFTPKTGLDVLTVDVRALVLLTVGLGVVGTGLAFIMYYHVIERLGRSPPRRFFTCRRSARC